jgi:hypothetical protein
MNGLRKCGICTQWNFIQPQKIKISHSQVKDGTEEYHLKQS